MNIINTNGINGPATDFSSITPVILVNISGNYISGVGSDGPNGDVVGPASSVDNSIIRFNGPTGKSIQGSNITLSDTNVFTGTNISIFDSGTLDLRGDVVYLQDKNDPNTTLTLAGSVAALTAQNNTELSTQNGVSLNLGQTVFNASLTALSGSVNITATGISLTPTAGPINIGGDVVPTQSGAFDLGSSVRPLDYVYSNNFSGPNSCKAWVSFSGAVGGCTIYNSYNVSSVTRVGLGRYFVNFTTNFPNTNYSTVVSSASTNGRVGVLDDTQSNYMSVSGVGVGLLDPTAAAFNADSSRFNVQIF